MEKFEYFITPQVEVEKSVYRIVRYSDLTDFTHNFLIVPVFQIIYFSFLYSSMW